MWSQQKKKLEKFVLFFCWIWQFGDRNTEPRKKKYSGEFKLLFDFLILVVVYASICVFVFEDTDCEFWIPNKGTNHKTTTTTNNQRKRRRKIINNIYYTYTKLLRDCCVFLCGQTTATATLMTTTTTTTTTVTATSTT